MNKKTTILYLQKNRIKVYQFLSKNQEVPDTQEYDYQSANIIKVFKQIKNDFKTKNVRILPAKNLSKNRQFLQNISIASYQSGLKIKAIEKKNLDPILSLLQKTDPKNKDKQNISLEPLTIDKVFKRNKKPEVYLKNPLVFKKPLFNKKLFLLLILILGVTLVIAGILSMRSKNINTSSDDNKPTEKKQVVVYFLNIGVIL